MSGRRPNAQTGLESLKYLSRNLFREYGGILLISRHMKDADSANMDEISNIMDVDFDMFGVLMLYGLSER